MTPSHQLSGALGCFSGQSANTARGPIPQPTLGASSPALGKCVAAGNSCPRLLLVALSAVRSVEQNLESLGGSPADSRLGPAVLPEVQPVRATSPLGGAIVVAAAATPSRDQASVMRLVRLLELAQWKVDKPVAESKARALKLPHSILLRIPWRCLAEARLGGRSLVGARSEALAPVLLPTLPKGSSPSGHS